jgi:AcrR family transcriptional regulator
MLPDMTQRVKFALGCYSRPMSQDPVPLRERTRRAVRKELQTVAIALFLEQGFEATTVEQIAEAAGLSRRSFHRYFASKDDVLTAALEDSGAKIAAGIAARPETDRPWLALRRGFDDLVAGAGPEAVPLIRAMLQSTALSSSHAQKEANWQRAMSDALEPRLANTPDRPLQARALAAAALACLTAAQLEWVAGDGTRPLGPLLDVAMTAVAPLD